MRLVLDGKTYDLDSVQRLSLMDVLRFNREAQRGDWGITWADVEELTAGFGAMSTEERKRHPGSSWLLALAIWRAMREDGEDVSFEAAIDRVPALGSDRVRWLPDPQDRKEPDHPRKARPTRKGSGRA